MSSRRRSSRDIERQQQDIKNKLDREFQYFKNKKESTQSTSIYQSIEQNILLLGPRKSGKTTLVNVLRDPHHIPPHLTVSSLTNKNINKEEITLKHRKLTIVEIPGEMLDRNHDLAKINQACLNMGVAQFDHVCICVSFQNGIFEEDIKLFERIITHFGKDKIKPYLSLIVTRCESKDNRSRDGIKNEVYHDVHLSRLMEWFHEGIHFTGAINPTDWEQADEEVIINESQSVYNDRYDLLKFFENSNMEPFVIQLR
jgi:ABC-type branched-subunit amino acid transport system ATPase component